MTISLRSVATNPPDNSSLYDGGPASVPWNLPTAAVAGDHLEAWCTRRGLVAPVMDLTGGQAWTPGTLRQTGSTSTQKWWCRFNGTWSNTPSVVSANNALNTIELQMTAMAPTNPANTWAVDVNESCHSYIAPANPYNVTVPGQLSIAASTFTSMYVMSTDHNTWSAPNNSYLNQGLTQYRVADPSGFKPTSVVLAYKVQTVAGDSGNMVVSQTALQPDPGLYVVTTYKELSSGTVTVTSVSDAVIKNTETAVPIAGTTFGASQGAGSVIISPTNNILDAGAIPQTVTSWGDTAIQFTAALSSFGYFTNLYVFVKNNAGVSNATGFVIQREAIMNLTGQLQTKAGANQINLTNIRYRVTAGTVNGTLVTSGTNLTSDASGNVTIPPVTLTSGGSVAPGDDVWVELAQDGVSPALSPSFSGKVSPVYT